MLAYVSFYSGIKGAQDSVSMRENWGKDINMVQDAN